MYNYSQKILGVSIESVLKKTEHIEAAFFFNLETFAAVSPFNKSTTESSTFSPRFNVFKFPLHPSAISIPSLFSFGSSTTLISPTFSNAFGCITIFSSAGSSTRHSASSASPRISSRLDPFSKMSCSPAQARNPNSISRSFGKSAMHPFIHFYS